MEAESGFIRNGNADLYYEIAGDGPPLVCCMPVSLTAGSGTMSSPTSPGITV